MRKILATVVSTLEIFFKEKPDEIVYVEGSNPVRMAYYHKLITDYAELIGDHYIVKGGSLGKIEPFQKRKSYEFLLIKNREVVFYAEEPIIVMEIPKKIISEREKKLIQFLSTKKAEDLFPEKNKRAWENLKRAGLIKD